jgi:ribosomal-protein-alanine N-acetyltransferase
MFWALSQIYPEGFCVVFSKDRLIGYGIVLIEEKRGQYSWEKKAHMMNIAVHPEFRRKGIGKKIMYTIFQVLDRKDISEIYLEVRASNEIAVAFYENLGFKSYGHIDRFYGDEDAKVMKKKLP